MKFRASGLTDRGMLRSVNQDNLFVDPEGRLFIVADGMGGHAGGQEASRIAIEVVSQVILQAWESEASSPALLEVAIEKANDAILDDQVRHPERAEMGTTIVAIMYRDDQWWQVHVGDSRLYRSREQHLLQLTKDHTWVARAVESGDLSQEQARSHPWRHVLMQCLGRRELELVEIYPLEFRLGDQLLLCSDGLTEELSDSEILHHLCQMPSAHQLDQLVERLVQSAKDRGGRDNITVLLVASESTEEDEEEEFIPLGPVDDEPSEGMIDETLPFPTDDDFPPELAPLS
ncbi:MAG: serine/threonine-protein phosphatase [Limnothrix sp. CACIAM 69d]|nr:MAG: serine/threonine-protein phosphatase [Limnothrix sp. CACIAM 69d]